MQKRKGQMIKDIILVGLGGASGSILRYLVKILAMHLNFSGLIGTIAVNIIGSYLIGIAISTISDKSLTLLFIVGFLGGFTTFSTFSSETIQLLQHGESLKGFIYIILTVITCILMSYLGIITCKNS